MALKGPGKTPGWLSDYPMRQQNFSIFNRGMSPDYKASNLDLMSYNGPHAAVSLQKKKTFSQIKTNKTTSLRLPDSKDLDKCCFLLFPPNHPSRPLAFFTSTENWAFQHFVEKHGLKAFHLAHGSSQVPLNKNPCDLGVSQKDSYLLKKSCWHL